ncbi:hypothetical protein [Acinetobacter baumannii]|uniref:hypothetical protein n=1 Tax=Acinetobacter baumannii TaxID=470 RepID=UPI001FF2E4A9|nr:hypothetical protein [Acinetobacter baumannii]MCJ8813056.1 hypothetical protein [Acinetobacter baumannii]
MFEMSEFEEYYKNSEWFGTYQSDLMMKEAFEAGQQSQQAKVEELKATIKGNHGRIAELERLNRVKAQAIIDLHQEITELKASHHGEVIGHEVHFKKIKQERDELQTLYIQQGINMLKLQKRVEALTQTMEEVLEEMKYPTATFEEVIVCGVKVLEQALKGEG